MTDTLTFDSHIVAAARRTAATSDLRRFESLIEQGKGILERRMKVICERGLAFVAFLILLALSLNLELQLFNPNLTRVVVKVYGDGRLARILYRAHTNLDEFICFGLPGIDELENASVLMISLINLNLNDLLQSQCII